MMERLGFNEEDRQKEIRQQVRANQEAQEADLQNQEELLSKLQTTLATRHFQPEDLPSPPNNGPS